MKVFEETADYNSKQPEKEEEPEYPKEMMSKDRRIRVRLMLLTLFSHSIWMWNIMIYWNGTTLSINIY